jgi:hypothetical protein
MKITTSYPVIENGVDLTPNLYYDNASNDYYDNASGKKSKGRVRRGEGTFGTVAKNLFSKEAIAGRQALRKTKLQTPTKKTTKKVVQKAPEVIKEEVKVVENAPLVVTPPPTPVVEAPKGMSTGVKIGIAVGVVVLGVVGFMVYKKMSGSKVAPIKAMKGVKLPF